MWEYAFVIALLAFACIAGMKSLANEINTVLTNVSTTLTNST